MNNDLLIGGIDFDLWLSRIGRSRSTGLRWRKRGWVAPVNIDGHMFVAQEEIDRFWARAKSGEFAKEAGGIICMQREEANNSTSKKQGHWANRPACGSIVSIPRVVVSADAAVGRRPSSANRQSRVDRLTDEEAAGIGCVPPAVLLD